MKKNLDFRKRRVEGKQLIPFFISYFKRISQIREGYKEGDILYNCSNETWLVKSGSNIPVNEAADYDNSFFFGMSLLYQDLN